MVPEHALRTLTHQGIDSNWISVVTNHVINNGPIISELSQTVAIMKNWLASIPPFSPNTNPAPKAPSNDMLSRDVMELYTHMHKINQENKEICEDFAAIYKKLEALDSRLIGHSQRISINVDATSQLNERQHLDTTDLRQIFTEQEKRITSLEDELDAVRQDNKVYQEEVDDQRVLLSVFQDQMDRLAHQMSSLTTRVDRQEVIPQRHLESRLSRRNQEHSSSPDDYHSYDSEEEAVGKFPRAICTAEPAPETSSAPPPSWPRGISLSHCQGAKKE